MSSENKLKSGSLGLFSIVFFVVAAASPLTGIVGVLPVAFSLGNGAGVPGVYLLAGILLVLFSFGFVAMSKHTSESGAFYAYISKGLGFSSGLAGLNLALLGYICMQFAISAMFGFFTDELIKSFHIHSPIPWWGYSIFMQIIVILLGISKVEIGGKVLGLLMIFEIGIVMLLDYAILHRTSTIEFSSFAPSTLFSGNFGIAMVFAICSFIGFEATALYAEECKNPEKNISRATFIAVIIITLFFSFSAWAVIQHLTSLSKTVNFASIDATTLIFSMTQQLLGDWAVQAMSILLVTSLFAANQAFHNSLSRYLFTMGRDKLAWSRLSDIHKKHQTPYMAGIVQGIFMIIMLLLFGLFKLDPMNNVFAWSSVLGSMAILALQVGVCFAVIRFFKMNKHLNVSKWSAVIAPAISAAGMTYVLFNVFENLKVISGSSSPVLLALPWIILGTILLGFLKALHVKYQNKKVTLPILER
ncbi:APC family permease [Acinetobacter boissieri]|uniref:Amino acid transporter n=1 Tax=Acinetobacter boissieri TaxID=1219383 RepID=A0A1G6HKC4_9GAMM|nr:APC family permease [Acinetobacter boissieri]SDB94613.1 Amino acid transporter [Acinetobacter boissieri]